MRVLKSYRKFGHVCVLYDDKKILSFTLSDQTFYSLISCLHVGNETLMHIRNSSRLSNIRMFQNLQDKLLSIQIQLSGQITALLSYRLHCEMQPLIANNKNQ